MPTWRRGGFRNAAPKGTEKFAWVTPAPNGKSLLCKAATGHLYELPVSVLHDAAGRVVRRVAEARLMDYGYAAKAILPGGAEVDFPLDFVLHHCEPAYTYHKEKVMPFRIGARIKLLRESRGVLVKLKDGSYRPQSMSQTELAKKAGMAQPNLARIEKDVHVPSLETLERIAKALGVTWLALITGSMDRT